MGIYLILGAFIENFYLSSQESHFICGKTKKKAKNSDAAIMELAVKLSPLCLWMLIKDRKLVMVLHSAGLRRRRSIYLATGIR